MEEIQNKLEQYRLRKRRKEKIDEIKSKFKRFLMLGVGSNQDGDKHTETKIEIFKPEELVGTQHDSLRRGSDEPNEDLVLSTDEDDVTSQDGTQSADLVAEKESSVLKYLLWAVYFMFWTTLYVIAIQLKFGIVFLMFSALFGIYFNTRTGPKKKNEISAYSVFNKNCESIDGTLKAEQFEREMRYGAGSVK